MPRRDYDPAITAQIAQIMALLDDAATRRANTRVLLARATPEFRALLVAFLDVAAHTPAPTHWPTQQPTLLRAEQASRAAIHQEAT